MLHLSCCDGPGYISAVFQKTFQYSLLFQYVQLNKDSLKNVTSKGRGMMKIWKFVKFGAGMEFMSLSHLKMYTKLVQIILKVKCYLFLLKVANIFDGKNLLGGPGSSLFCSSLKITSVLRLFWWFYSWFHLSDCSIFFRKW